MRLLAFFIFLATSSILMSQEPTPPPDSAPNLPVWRAEMPGGIYVVALSTITTISSHEYVLDATARVTEVTIGTIGNLVARFYYIEPATPAIPGGLGQSAVTFLQDKAVEAADRLGADVWKKVVKNYPATTHAHTIEYRVESKAVLQKLQQSVESAWMRGKGATFKP